jgi:hypothetical protein
MTGVAFCRVCPRCDRPIVPMEKSVEMDDDELHLACALEELDEIGMDNDE